jgi:DNA-binding SARP family transcriptional activator
VIEEGCGVLRVRLGGRLRLDAGGVELPPPASRRARGVLAYLALHPGPHARAELDARFWPDVLDESARTSLRAALSELRRRARPGGRPRRRYPEHGRARRRRPDRRPGRGGAAQLK